MSQKNSFDYVIVGGGSAGCAMAHRLSESGEFSVCLLEAGPADKSPFIRIPSGVIPLLRSKIYNWQFWTAPEPNMGNRAMYCPRGKTLGGSSSINAQVYIRGNAWDYDHWASLGCTGWSYKDVLPYFRKLENFEPGLDAQGRMKPEAAVFHGQGGPLNVAERRDTNPLSEVFLEAAQQAGLKPTDDFNGAQQEGVGSYHCYHKGGERCSNARAYLDGAKDRPNLTIFTDAPATRILFEGKKAVGVRYVQKGRHVDVLARREVILAAGAINSPQLLLLSGIGPKAELDQHGITQIHELPGVGENLQDHLDIFVTMKSKTRLGLSFHPLSLWRNVKALFQYLLFRTGELTSNVAEVGGFLRSRPEEPAPDIQWHFVPLVNSQHAFDLTNIVKHYGYSIMTCDLRPQSRGRISLNSADPLAPPRIQFNYLSTQRDMDRLVFGIRKAREVLKQPAFAPHQDYEMCPGVELQTDAQLHDWIRQNAETVYHPVGSCKMGVDAMAVVDPRLRVRGVEGLRVADASIMPTLVGGNTNAPATMIGENGARMVLEDARAPAQTLTQLAA